MFIFTGSTVCDAGFKRVRTERQEIFKPPYALCNWIRTLIIKENEYEENLSTEQNQKSSYPWIPFADGHQGRTPGDQQAPCQRPQAPGPVEKPMKMLTENENFMWRPLDGSIAFRGTEFWGFINTENVHQRRQAAQAVRIPEIIQKDRKSVV